MASKIKSILTWKCPRCGEADLFIHKSPYFPVGKLNEMPKDCPKCGQPYTLETGFYYGAMYVGYALSVGMCIFLGFSFFFLVGLSYWMSVALLVLVMICVMPLIFRFARSIWINAFVKHEGEIAIKRYKKEQQGE